MPAGWSKHLSRQSAHGGGKVVTQDVEPWISAATNLAEDHDPVGASHWKISRQHDPFFERLSPSLGQKSDPSELNLPGLGLKRRGVQERRRRRHAAHNV